MFSYEERIRAVKLYIELGKRSAATRRQLGYPTKNSLASWYREFCLRGDLRAGCARRKPKYSDEQKKRAVEHYQSHGRCVSATLKALGYPGRVTLTAWVRELDPDARRYVVRRAHRGTRPLPLRQAAVYALCTRRGSAKAIAQRLDVDRVTLYNWKNQLLGRDAPASMKRDKEPPTKTDKAQLEKRVESLRRDIRQLQLERDLLKKANEILKKGLGVDLELLTNREKTMLVDALREAYAFPELLR